MGTDTAKALSDLANKINVCAAKSDDYRVSAACHLAEAKRLKKKKKSWKLAKAGETGDPAKAIAEMAGSAPRPA